MRVRTKNIEPDLLNKPKNRISVCVFLACVLAIISCENSIDIYTDREEGIYSMYGVLNMSEDRKYVRVYDTNSPPTAEATEQLDVQVTFKREGENFSEIMTDRVIEFDGVYTHNFYTDRALELDTEYIVAVEDLDGYTDSISAFTPKEIAVTEILVPQDDCNRITISATIEPVYFEIGEFIVYDIGFEHRDRLIWVTRHPVYFEEEERGTSFAINISPSVVIERAGGGANCIADNIGVFYFKFRHYGASGFGHQNLAINDSTQIINGKSLIALYESETFTFQVDTIFTDPPPTIIDTVRIRS